MLVKDSQIEATTPQEARILTFFDGMGPDLDGFQNTYLEMMADDVVWETVGLPPRVGLAAASDYLDSLHARTGMTYCDVELTALASSGDTVMTERIDTMKRSDGSTIFAFRIVGVTVLRGDRIVRYTDYCDLSVMARSDS